MARVIAFAVVALLAPGPAGDGPLQSTTRPDYSFEPLEDTQPPGYPFDDSDVYKVIEGASYTLSVHPDPELDAYVDGLIARSGG